MESEVSADTIEDIVTCWEGDEGMELHHENGIKTDNLVPKHSYVPWVTFNDVRTIEFSLNSTMHFEGFWLSKVSLYIDETFFNFIGAFCRQLF